MKRTLKKHPFYIFLIASLFVFSQNSFGMQTAWHAHDDLLDFDQAPLAHPYGMGAGAYPQQSTQEQSSQEMPFNFDYSDLPADILEGVPLGELEAALPVLATDIFAPETQALAASTAGAGSGAGSAMQPDFSPAPTAQSATQPAHQAIPQAADQQSNSEFASLPELPESHVAGTEISAASEQAQQESRFEQPFYAAAQPLALDNDPDELMPQAQPAHAAEYMRTPHQTKGKKPYKCTYDGCRKSFAREDILTNHMITHSGEKPHKCTYDGCGKNFGRKDALIRHMKIHLQNQAAVVPTAVQSAQAAGSGSGAQAETHAYSESRTPENSAQPVSDSEQPLHTEAKEDQDIYQTLLLLRSDATKPQVASQPLVLDAGPAGADHENDTDEIMPQAAEQPAKPAQDDVAEKKQFKCTHEGCGQIFVLEENLKRHMKKHAVLTAQIQMLAARAKRTGAEASAPKTLEAGAGAVSAPASSTAQRFKCRHRGCTHISGNLDDLVRHRESHLRMAQETQARESSAAGSGSGSGAGAVMQQSLSRAPVATPAQPEPMAQAEPRGTKRAHPQTTEAQDEEVAAERPAKRAKTTHQKSDAPVAVDKQKKTFACTECSQKYTRKSDLTRHAKTHTPVETSSSSESSSDDSSDSSYQEESSESESSSESDSSTETETDSSSEEEEEEEEENSDAPRSSTDKNKPKKTPVEKTKKCSHPGCNKQISTSNFARHMKMHAGEKGHVCTHAGCTMSFISSSDLKIHERTHTGEKPYKCTHAGCDKSFASNQLLSHHKSTHTGEKIACPHPGCGKLVSKKNLSSHKKIHAGEKTKCAHPGCGKLVSISNIARHMKMHAGEKSKCTHPGCDKLISISNFARHMKQHDRDTDETD